MEAVLAWILANPEISILILNSFWKYLPFGGKDADLLLTVVRGVVTGGKAVVKKKNGLSCLALIIASTFIFSGCGMLKGANISVDPEAKVLTTDLIAFTLGMKFARQHPDKVPQAIRSCDIILNSDDSEYVGTQIKTGLVELGKLIDDPDTEKVINRLMQKLKIEVSVQPDFDMTLARVAVQAFKEGME